MASCRLFSGDMRASSRMTSARGADKPLNVSITLFARGFLDHGDNDGEGREGEKDQRLGRVPKQEIGDFAT